MGGIWQEWVVNNLAYALNFLYDFLAGVGIPSWGVAIVIFTIVVKVIMIPLTLQQLRSSKAMQAMQPAMRELQQKYGKDKERLAQEQMKLYQEYGVNPMMGCLPMLIQMPVWIGLYGALLTLGGPTGLLVGGAAVHMSGGFLWINSLTAPEGFPYILAILTGVSQWMVQRMMTPKDQDPQQAQMNRMMQFMPIMFVVMSLSVNSGLVVYWVTSNVFSAVQQYFVTGWGSLADFGGIISRFRPANQTVQSAQPALKPKAATSGSRGSSVVESGENNSAASGESEGAGVEQTNAQSTTKKRRSRRR